MLIRLRILWHKIMHWEYWPSYIIYAPTFLYWVIQAIRFRRLDFYKFANPCMTNGGLYDDSKYQMYQSLPAQYIPKSYLVKAQSDYDIGKILADVNINLPCVAKPDKGYRGIAVQKVYNLGELSSYLRYRENDTILQEWIDMPCEISVFYVRYPDNAQGSIASLTEKKFLSVIGDGKSTIRELLQHHMRHAMQISRLNEKINLDIIPAAKQALLLVPYGNHNLGTTFIDGSHKISEALQEKICPILNQVDGFHYGRLDIRCNSIEDLSQGGPYQIIEVNGAKSEPTHIYDTSYSFWAGQKEIFQHQNMMMKIIKHNLGEVKEGIG